MSTPRLPSLLPAAHRLRTAARAARRTTVRRAVTGWAVVRRTFRRSLQLRIITITLLASGLLVGAFGVLVAETIARGIMTAKERAAEDQVSRGVIVASEQLGSSTARSDPSLNSAIQRALALLLPGTPGGSAEQGSEVVVVMVPSSVDSTQSGLQWPDTAPDARSVIHPELRRAIQNGSPPRIAHQIVSADLDNLGTERYLVYGSPVTVGWGRAELYYVFPLNAEVATADLVRTTVAVTGVALMVLLAVIAGIVTGLVVRPVRVAAVTAQRLSAGLLDQRMEVRGEDDLARLASAFNQMAANLQRQIMRLEEMSRLQRRFTSDVSHELRTPITTVRMAADLLFAERTKFDPEMARSVELLQLELDRFESLLTDLLEISRFDAGFAALDAEPTNLVPIVRRVVERLGPLASRAGVPLELDLPDGPVIAEVDVRRVERILRNLIGNAVEHGEARPVRVTMRANDSSVSVTVRDHGVGLKSGEEKLVFNRFWRADPSRARQTGGTGLGLSISIEDARLHGGWLEAWGAPSAGAQFRLTIPVRAGDRLVAAPLRLVPADALGNGHTPASHPAEEAVDA